MAAELHVDSVVRGHHVYKSIWTPVLGEELLVEQEHGNEHDRYAVSVKKNDMIVGHLPRSLSRVSWFFLSHRGKIECVITGRRKLGLGLEVPCTYTFIGNQRSIKKLKRIPELSQ